MAAIKWIEDGPNPSVAANSSSAAAVAGVKPRRAHTKSRTGCSTCKSRRKKCDEKRPACGQCHRKGIHCDYLSDTRLAAQSASSSQSHSQHTMSRQNSMSRRNARDQITEVLELLGEQNATPNTSRPKSVDVLRMIDHFMNERQSSWIGTPATQKAMQEHGTRVGVDAPHLLHAIVAFSAAHLDHLHPDPKLRVTALHHYGRLVAVYADEIQRLETGTVNRLFGTCIMLTMLSYLVVGYDNPDLLCNPEEHDCNWDAFRSLGGVRIMQGVPTYLEELGRGVWVSMLEEVRERKEAMENGPKVVPPWWANIITGLCDLCGVSRDLQHGNSIYLEPLRGLNMIVYGSLDDTKVGQMMHYIGNLPIPFSKVLENLDPRAMLIILHWHALLMLVGQWWATHTGMVASRRTIAYLWKVGGEDIRKMLVFPAGLCGLDLQSLDEWPSKNREAHLSVSPDTASQTLVLL